MLFFILGAPDPEMALIESLLRRCRLPFAYALDDQKGNRVHSENAYRTQGVSRGKNPDWVSVWIECAPHDSSIRRQYIIDHHRPGDPGYSGLPERFLASSSLGQCIGLLASKTLLPDKWLHKKPVTPEMQYIAGNASWELLDDQWYCANSAGNLFRIPKYFALAAAADHCLSHAYQGHCPGISSSALQSWRIASRAKRQGVSRSRVEMEILKATQMLQIQPFSSINGYPFRIIESPIKEMKDASALLGESIMYSRRDTQAGRLKIAVRSICTDQVRAWMNWARSNLQDVYGDPVRGFAGGYVN